MLKCAICGREYSPRNINQKTCSRECYYKLWYKKTKNKRELEASMKGKKLTPAQVDEFLDKIFRDKI
ncbi:MAG: hypothetical protein IKT98_06535 [Selenomonadaceae bacterium]|nr:hypothetical protein [Selenomonadaceae bacterium]